MINPIAALMPADLHRYLITFAPAAKVGTAQQCSDCLLSRWFSAILCVPVGVRDGYAIIDMPGIPRTRYALAEWQNVTMQLVDDIPDETGTFRITAAAALEILGRMQRMGVA